MNNNNNDIFERMLAGVLIPGDDPQLPEMWKEMLG